MSTHHTRKSLTQWVAHLKPLKKVGCHYFFYNKHWICGWVTQGTYTSWEWGHRGPEIPSDSFREMRQPSSGTCVTLPKVESKVIEVLRSTCPSPCKGPALLEITVGQDCHQGRWRPSWAVMSSGESHHSLLRESGYRVYLVYMVGQLFFSTNNSFT